MRSLKTILVISAVALAAACGRSEKKQTAGLSDDLRSDLALASSSLAYPDLKLAPDEQAPPAAPKRATAPKRQPRAQLQAPVPAEMVTPASEETVDVAAAAPEASTEPDAVAATAPSNEPVIASPRPTPVPVQYPGDIGDRSGGRPTVVIRGGSPGEDHCEIHSGRRRGGILINNRMPPMGVPTFPGGGIPINPLGRVTLPRIR